MVARMFLRLSAFLFLAGFMFTPAPAAAIGGKCLTVAENAPFDHRRYIRLAALKPDEVEITFVGHSTFRITSPGGTIIVTDYAGNAGEGPVPDVATMNHAHETHFTYFPDERIKHVLKGWNPDGDGPAEQILTVGDVAIRNVATDIRRWDGSTEEDGNSIFIFEVANLCIGHVGHLHHELSNALRGWIGHLDIVMVPVDGSHTLDHFSMMNVLQDIGARIILPMHYFGGASLAAFLERLSEKYEVEVRQTATAIFTERDLPPEPKIIVLPGY